ncbi:MAG: ribosome biogenesis GTP-binding protein YihA/YsxC [Desulforegulaceae bacterium]|jgi:GTP-binding protein|nr:ribosome biogenesis GTP-binding protein YihA/YsxC [Desulforegulaceae bacterium]
MESHNENKGYIIKSAEFLTSAGSRKEYPEAVMPEIAFAGRSNVGKSTLINCLVNRKKLVKTSNTPGRTQRINFFEVNNVLRFVDLPGYGYAKVSKKMRAEWEKMIEDYLLKRSNLCCLVWIMDIRRDVAEFEHNFALWLTQNNINHINVLTKADKFSKSKQIAQKKKIALKLNIDEDLLITASGIKGTGKEEVWEKILNFAGVLND